MVVMRILGRVLAISGGFVLFAFGVAALGVCSGSQPRGRLEMATPLGCLESVAALPEWLDGGPEGLGPDRQEKQS